MGGVTTVIVNDKAAGVWSARVGAVLTYVGPGMNPMHTEVRRPGGKAFALPTTWLDNVPDQQLALSHPQGDT
jgi:hypothetical protein